MDFSIREVNKLIEKKNNTRDEVVSECVNCTTHTHATDTADTSKKD